MPSSSTCAADTRVQRHASLNQQGRLHHGAIDENDRGDDDLVEISRPAIVTELVGNARCLTCQGQNRRCHVEQGALNCLQCQLPEACLFQRKIFKTAQLSEFEWHDLVGPSVDARKQRALPSFHSVHSEASHPEASTRDSPTVYTGENAPEQSTPQVNEADIASSRLSGTYAPSLTATTPSAESKFQAGTTIHGFVPIVARDLAAEVYRELNANTKRASVRFHVCPTCGRSYSQIDDLRKHVEHHHQSTHTRSLRHSKSNKPHKCPVGGCDRQTTGFVTSNDLDRHLKSVHGMEIRGSRVFKCFGQSCTKADKIWPRLDNFKQHLRNIHGHEDITNLLLRSDEWFEKRSKAIAETQPEDAHHDFLTNAEERESIPNQQSAPIRNSSTPASPSDSQLALVRVNVDEMRWEPSSHAAPETCLHAATMKQYVP